MATVNTEIIRGFASGSTSCQWPLIIKNMKLKTIFEIIEGRKWDNFGWSKNMTFYIDDNKFKVMGSIGDANSYSLADLLANKSWCQAVWVEWTYLSTKTFEILRGEGTKKALNYIYKTMKK
jgi:hypothetical protein